jgi:hypothetical protein
VPTGTQADVKPLIPGDPTEGQLEIKPFSHVFRAGSAIRITIDTPTAALLWIYAGFAYQSTQATDAILTGPGYPSSILLPVIPGQHTPTPLPACGVIQDEPCRPANTPLPAGTLNLNQYATHTLAWWERRRAKPVRHRRRPRHQRHRGSVRWLSSVDEPSIYAAVSASKALASSAVTSLPFRPPNS